MLSRSRPPGVADQPWEHGLDRFKGRVSQRVCRLGWGLGGLGADLGQRLPVLSKHTAEYIRRSKEQKPDCVWLFDTQIMLHFVASLFSNAHSLCCIVGCGLMRLMLWF